MLITGYVVSIEAAQRHLLGCAQIASFVCASIQSGRAECVRERSKSAGGSIVREPIGKLDHRTCVSA
jgi:hypothetical protein